MTVATPLHTHADIVCDAARAGLHVLCEKPLAHTNEDGERMIKAMRDANRFLGINFNSKVLGCRGAGVCMERAYRACESRSGGLRLACPSVAEQGTYGAVFR